MNYKKRDKKFFIALLGSIAQNIDSKLILDTLTVSPATAYSSSRKLRTAYTGFAIRVRRSSDNAETDIGFVNNELDTVTLLAFCGSGSGFVKTWYDQSGNARHATQATAGKQPRIVTAGVLETMNSKPALYFDGVDDYIEGSLSLPAPWSFAAVLDPNATQVFFAMALVLNVLNIEYRRESSGNFFNLVLSNTNFLSGNIGYDSRQISLIQDASNSTFYSNGVSLGSVGDRPLINTLNVGDRDSAGLYPYRGHFSEMVVFPSTLSTADRQALERDQGARYGITVA